MLVRTVYLKKDSATHCVQVSCGVMAYIFSKTGVRFIMMIVRINSKFYEPCLNRGESPNITLKYGVNIHNINGLFAGSYLDMLVDSSLWSWRVGEMRMGNSVQEANGRLIGLWQEL